MTVIATASNPQFSVSRIDIDRGGPTYTIDTLRDLRAAQPGRGSLLHHRRRRARPDPDLAGRRGAVLARPLHRRHPARPRPDGRRAARRAGSRWWRCRRWRSRPPTAGRGSPRAIRSGIWCRTVWCATSTSASCTAASEATERGTGERPSTTRTTRTDQQPQIVGYDEYGQPVYQQPPAVRPATRSSSRSTLQQHAAAPGSSRATATTRTAQQQRHAAARSSRPHAVRPVRQQPQQHGSSSTSGSPRRHGYDTGSSTAAVRHQAAAVASRSSTAPARAAAQPRPQRAGPRGPVPERSAGPARRPGLPHRAVLLHRGAGRGLRRRHRLAEVHREPHRAPRGGQAPRPQPRRRARRRPGAGRSWAASATSGTRASCPASADDGRRRRDGRRAAEARRDRRPSAQHQEGAAPPRRCSSTTPPPSRAPPSCCPTPSPSPATTAPPPPSASPSRTTAPTGTRESLGTLLGADIKGTWRLDTPYLENLVELVGSIDLDTDADRARRRRRATTPLVKQGEDQTLDGRDGRRLRHLPGPGRAADQAAASGSARSCRASLRKLSQRPEGARPSPWRRSARSSTRR